MATIEFFYDCSSPWTYLAFTGIEPLARQYGAEIVWRPVLVGGIFNAVNPSVYRSRENPIPAKSRYYLKDMADWARLAGISIVFPPTVFPVNAVKAMRGALVAAAADLQVPYARAVFEAYFRDDRDISQLPLLCEIAHKVGLDPDRFAARIDDPEIKAALKANTDEVIARGGFGSPTIFLDGDDMYFGNDRLPLLAAKLRGDF